MYHAHPRSTPAGSRRRFLRGTLSAGLAAVLAVTAAVLPAVPAQAAPVPPVDGRSAASAAASCWEVKQNDPKSASGVYWLLTPSMAAPEQFYCDQTTDGGGWVLIGRGRQGWQEFHQGVGTPGEVASTVTGPAAFSPRQLPSTVVDGLLDGGRPDELGDGVRLRRAMDAGGTSWQEVRMSLAAKPYWNWALGARTPAPTFSFANPGQAPATGTNGTTGYFFTDTAHNYTHFADSAATGWYRGFRYGSAVKGSTSGTSHLWSTTEGGSGAIPFTQVYLRPKVTQAAFAGKAVPDAGTPAVQRRALPENGALPTRWGAVERADGRTGELNTEVQAFAQVGQSVFAGGNFKALQKDQAGTGRVGQSYLAAFDVGTGELRTGFRPVLDGQVKALAALPGNRLAVGGQFSTVNGTSSPGFAVLDASTGQLDDTWKLRVENLLTSGVLQVRSLSVQGDWLHLGGAFTHLTGGQATSRVYARGAARVAISTGTPDASWNPNFNGTVVSVHASPQRDRLYAAGYFTQSQGNPAFRLAAVRTVAGAPLASPEWTWDPSIPVDYANPAERGYQLAVREQGPTVWAGGSEHSMFGYDRSSFERTSENITTIGGDMQAITSTGDTVFGSCHCGHWNNGGATKWTGNVVPTIAADRIDLIGAWDAASGRYLPEFNPKFKGHHGYGVWSALVDSTGTLWAGGDVANNRTVSGSTQWAGGFARFAPRDAKAPAGPSELAAAQSGTDDALTWKGSPEPGVTYQVLRNDRTVATTQDTSLRIPRTDGARYAVRAADAAGNLSASTPVRQAKATAAPVPDTLVAAGSSWKYLHQDVVVSGDWASPGFDDSAWKSGSAVLGWGSTGLGTTLVADGTRPLTTYFRRSVEVPDASAVKAVTLTTRADDGIAVYVNGQEVVRSNLPEGRLTGGTWATAAPRTATAAADPVTVEVPGWALRDGKNVIAAEMHSNWRSTPDASFELTATATPGEAPPAPEPEVTVVAAGSDWAYRHQDSAPPQGWTQPGTAVDWPTGPAPLGWGSAVATELSAGDRRPLATQYRRQFTITDPAELDELVLTTRADDGIVVHVNGHEVVRANLPDGSVDWTTYALTAPRTHTALAAPVTAVVPDSVLRAGTNTITASVHVNYRSTPDSTFNLELRTRGGDGAGA